MVHRERLLHEEDEEALENVSMVDMVEANENRAGIKERTVPGWCRGLMEIALWSAIAVGVFFVQLLGMQATCAVCGVLISVMTAMWLLHGFFLRRPPVAFTVSTAAGVALLIFFAAAEWETLGDEAVIALICLPVFLAIPGAFTRRQVSRFLAFLCFAGSVQVFYCLVSPTLLERKESFFHNLWEGNDISGTLITEAELTAFLTCSVCAAAAYALLALTALAPERGMPSTGGTINRLASPCANLILLSTLCVSLALIPLFLCRSLYPFPTVVLAGIVLSILLALKRLLSSIPVTLIMLVLLLSAAANLALPDRSGKTPIKAGETSEGAFSINLANLKAGVDARVGHRISSSSDAGSVVRQNESSGWRFILEESDWGKALTRCGPTGFFLLMLFCGLLLVEGLRAMILNSESSSALLAGAIGGLLALLLTGIWGSFLANPGLALLAAAFCAMTAAGGEYDEEFEEVEIVP